MQYALMRKVALSLFAFLVASRYGLGILAWRISERLEQPKYTVLDRLDGCTELRAYPAYVVAEAVFFDGESKKAMSSGFRKVAGYVFGKNAVRGSRGRASAKMSNRRPAQEHKGLCTR